MKQDNEGRGRGASVDREKDQATPSRGRGKPFGKGNIIYSIEGPLGPFERETYRERPINFPMGRLLPELKHFQLHMPHNTLLLSCQYQLVPCYHSTFFEWTARKSLTSIQQGEVTYDRIDSISTIMLGYVFLLHRWEKPKPSTGRAWSNKTKTQFIVTEKCTSSFWSGSGVTGENCLLRPQNFERERKQPGSPRTEWGTASPEIPSSIPRTAAQQRWIHLRPYTHFSKSLRSAIGREYE